MSHLLTHLASKSHLSSKFVIGQLAKTDSERKQVLDSYMRWMHIHDLDQMLEDRLQQKARKKSGGSTKSSNSSRRCE